MSSGGPVAAAERSSHASRAAAHVLQAKLSIGRSNDSYEQEADRVADAVVARNSAPTVSESSGAVPAAVARRVAPKISRLRDSSAQRQAEEEEPQAKLQRQEEEEEPQASLQRQTEEEEPQARLQRQEEEEEPQAKLQRQEEEEEPQARLQRQEEEEELQAKLQRQEEEEEPQAKLQRQEEEEEPQASLQRQEEEEEPQAKLQLQEEEEEPQAKLQLQEEEEEPQAKLQLQQEEEVQARLEPRANVRDKRMFPELGKVEPKLFERKGKGEALDDETRIAMETSFGADFSGVRIHSGADAVAMARDLKAQAFTHGRDVFFNAGKFEPDSMRGRALLAHELAHVVQQGAAEQPLSEERVEKNNAERGQPPPEPTDRRAVDVEEQTRARIEENERELGEATEEAPPAPVPAAGPQPSAGTSAAEAGAAGATAEPAAAEAEAATGEPAAGGASAAAAAEGTEAKEKAAPEGKAAAGEKVVAGKKAGAKEKAAGEEEAAGVGVVGAFLRKMTRPVLAAKKKAIGRLAAAQRQKEPADTKLAQTEKAVEPPAEEGPSRARAAQVETVDQVTAPEPDEAAAKQRFDEALDKAVPRSIEEVDEFKEEGKGRVVGQAVKEVVTADTQQVKGTYQEIDNPPEPEPPGEAPEELPPVETAPETEPIDPGAGVVGEVQSEHTDLSEFEEQSDALLEQEGMKEEHLEMVDEGELAEAKEDRKAVKAKVEEGPREVKLLEKQEKQAVGKELQKEEQEARRKMGEERRKELHGARDDQKKTKSKLEQKRQEVTEHINAVYQRANETVAKKLEDLEAKSLRDFDEGEKEATRTFEDGVKRRMDAFKARRYDRFGGSLLWAKDKLFGMDDLPEVKGIFDGEKSRFVSSIDALVARITAENKRVVAECKEIVAAARAEIETYVEGLGPALRKTGQEALTDIRGKLAALDQKVADKEKELQAKLAAKREAAIKAIEEKIEKMKEEMSGLVSKLGNLLLNAMIKFFRWALKKAGYASDQLMGILDKGKAVVKKVVTDPIGFIGNLIKAVKNGIDLFATNIKKHLIGGLISWLTGAMADVPIQLPEKFDVKGVLHLVLQILGLTWDRIRVKLVKRLGEKVVRIAETSVAIVKRLITEGPMALWEMIKEKAAEIKQKVMDGIRNWVIVEVVKQGIIKLASFLNPAGAIVQAILAIYNTVMFFVENWDRIVQFVKTVFNSIADIAMGKLSAAAQAVERAMAMTIPIILNFIARLLGLSGIGKTVTKIIKQIRKPIDKVVDKVIAMVAKMAKKLLKKVKAGAKALKEKGLAVIAWWKQKKSFRTKGGASHTLQFRGQGKSAQLMVRTTPQTIESYLLGLDVPKNDPRYPKLQQARTIAASIETITRSHSKTKPVDAKRAQQITQDMTKLSRLLMDLDQGGLADLPAKPLWDHKPDSKKASLVDLLSTKTSGGGSTPSGSTPEFDFLRNRGLTDKGDKWVRMHLINERVGGTGAPKNWVPAPNSVNTGGKVTSFETSLKNLVEKKGSGNQPNVVWAVAKVTATHPPKATYQNLSHFPRGVSFKAGLHFLEKRKWQKDATPRIAETVVVPEPSAGDVPSLSQPSHTELSALDPIFTRTTVDRMREALAADKKPFASIRSFAVRLQRIQPNNPLWQDKIPEIESAANALYSKGLIKVR